MADDHLDPFDILGTECDKAFTRTDALQKHMRVQHGEVILPGRRPPSKKSRTARSGRAGSVDSGDGAHDDDEAGASEDEDAKEPEWDADDEAAFAEHPKLGRGFVGYVVMRAKFEYAIKENEERAHQVEVLATREAELGAQCEELLRRIMRNEIGYRHSSWFVHKHSCADATPFFAQRDKSQDEQERRDLEQFLTQYSHKSEPIPSGWTGEFGAVQKNT